MRYFILALMLILSSCAITHKIDIKTIHKDTYVSCHSNLDKHSLNYLKSMRHDYPSDIFPQLTISNITDIDYKPWSINFMEWTQYVCTEKELP